jgi:hypothetical protein
MGKKFQIRKSQTCLSADRFQMGKKFQINKSQTCLSADRFQMGEWKFQIKKFQIPKSYTSLREIPPNKNSKSQIAVRQTLEFGI